MKMDIVAGSQNDEFYTPEYAIIPILKYLPKGKIVWCPFDSEQSHFVKMIRTHGCDVINTHVENGYDFFMFEPKKEYDYIISNPPYSKKNEVFNRLFALNKRFAMLVGVVGLFESQKRFQMFKNNDWEIMFLNKRVSYFKSFTEQTPSMNPPFSSVYITKGLLPEKIMFEEIIK